MKTCRWCQRPIARTDNTSQNWHCSSCNRWDAASCLVCGTTVGFPRDLADIVLAASPVIPTTRKNAAREIEQVRRKATVYCDLHYHDMYFTTRRGDARTCVLCHTSWDRRDPAHHTVT